MLVSPLPATTSQESRASLDPALSGATNRGQQHRAGKRPAARGAVLCCGQRGRSCLQGLHAPGREERCWGQRMEWEDGPENIPSSVTPSRTLPSSNPFLVTLPGGSAKREKLNTLISQVWLFSLLFVFITDPSSFVGFFAPSLSHKMLFIQWLLFL